MISITLLAAAAMTFAQPPIGQRTTSPESLLAELGLAPDDPEIAQAVAEAERHPLGSDRNPIRVGGPEGERAYIARLRCSNGSSPQVGQRGSMGVGPFGTIVDGYPLDCGAAAPGRTMLIMDMYHAEHREDRAPPGFSIAPR